MKSYTDIEQSKKLAEILPIESADMAWCNNSIKGINYTDKYSANLYTVKEMKDTFDKALVGWDKYWELIPCWSLTALLNLMICPNLEEYIKGKWDLTTFTDESLKTPIEVQDCESAVDACYEMILKLNELKLR